eukprot:2790170-Alexandrium_andersonii.AAC.1
MLRRPLLALLASAARRSFAAWRLRCLLLGFGLCPSWLLSSCPVWGCILGVGGLCCARRPLLACL